MKADLPLRKIIAAFLVVIGLIFSPANFLPAAANAQAIAFAEKQNAENVASEEKAGTDPSCICCDQGRMTITNICRLCCMVEANVIDAPIATHLIPQQGELPVQPILTGTRTALDPPPPRKYFL